MRILSVNNNYNNKLSNSFNNKQEQPSIETISTEKSGTVNFKGGKESKLSLWIGKMYGKYYAKPMSDKEWLQKASEKMTKFPGSMTEHMTVLGSILTSSVYMYKTLTNKDLDSDKRKTLAINQGLCCLIPTIGAYTISNSMGKFKKDVEYAYRGIKEQQVALGEITPKEAEKLKKSLGEKLKGLNALTGLITFTLIYRYVTPVIVTPIANKIGNRLNEKNQIKKQEVAQQPEEQKNQMQKIA